jgi:hypothetical protein
VLGASGEPRLRDILPNFFAPWCPTSITHFRAPVRRRRTTIGSTPWRERRGASSAFGRQMEAPTEAIVSRLKYPVRRANLRRREYRQLRMRRHRDATK